MLNLHQRPQHLPSAFTRSAHLRLRPLRTAVSSPSTLAQPAPLDELHLGAPPLRFRSVFISDLHLGTPQSQAESLLDFLQTVQADTLYLVGDILDGWKLKTNWYWPESHTAVLHQLYELARKGTRICYVPGNHDEAARAYLTDEAVAFGNVEVVQETMHTCADGRRFLVLHGDRCDTSVHLSSALTRALGDWVYDQSKFAIEMVGRYEEALANEAKRLGVDGVICGHIHKPIIRRIDNVIYVNDGDWVDSCSALVEDFAGQLDIVYWQPIFERRQAERARLARAAAAPAAVASAGSDEAGVAGETPAAHSAEEAPVVGPATPQYGPGGTQAVDLALRIMIGSSVPSKRRLDLDRHK